MTNELLPNLPVEALGDYEIEIRIRNARILGLMRRAGLPNASALARKSGVNETLLGRLLNLKVTPLQKMSPNYREMVWKLADALNCHPDDMFSDRQRTSFLASNKKAVEVSEAEVEGHLARLEHAAPDEVVRLSEQKSVLGEALKSLSAREQRVLSLRYGLDGGPERTLDEIAGQMGVQKERIRQIEMRALGRLRGPAHAKKLAAAVDFEVRPVPAAAPRRPPEPAAPPAAPPARAPARAPVSWMDVTSSPFEVAKERWLRGL